MTKLFVAGFFISVVPIIISQYISFNQISKTLQMTYAEELKHKAELTTLLINQSISHRLSELDIVSKGIDEWLRAKDYKILKQKLSQFKSSRYDINAISVVDASSNILVSTKDSASAKAFESIFKSFMEQNKQNAIYISDLVIDDEESFLYIIKKLDEGLSFIVVELNMSNIEFLLFDFDEEVAGDKPVYLLDADKKVILTTGDKSEINNPYIDKEHLVQKKNQNEGIYFFKDSKGDDVVSTYEKVYQFGRNDSFGWIVCASIPTKLINKSVSSSLEVNKQVSLFIIVVTFLVLTLLARSFVRPIKNIVEVAKRISKGDYDTHINKKYSTSEFDTLSSVINDMVDKIKSRTDKLKEQKLLLESLAHYDTLTKIPNRLLFKDRIDQAISRAHRDGSEFALLYIDLDEFKHINDSFGHDTGDEVLKEVVSRISSVIRAEDTFARIGGDEFTIILEEIKDIDSVSAVADKIIDVVKEPIEIGSNIFKVSTSIGVSVYPKDSTNKSDLIKYADIAMYKAKAEGRDNYQYYSEYMKNYSLERIRMKQDIDNALENDEFEIYYQAQMNAREHKYIGMEALVRWNHPIEGFISPAKFLSISEEIGVIVDIDRWVMRKAMKQVVSWRAKGLDVQTLSLNLSIQHLQHDSFIPTLKSCMQESGCKGEWIEFEITETFIMSNYAESISKIKEMNSLGIKISIDDFGTGYSSLAYLKHLPIDKLKIDKSFIEDIPDDEDDVSIVKSIIGLCKGLNLSVIAEGVETQEQKEFLLENGCELIQGYLYAKPKSSSEFEKEFLSA
jgi:diguanylate cyclase (GGDEF)-like protein